MKTPKDYIVFPLDVPDYDQAMGYVETLKEEVGLFKVGLELFISQGPKILKAIGEVSSAGIFLDLKLHDIPATVQRAFRAASLHRPAFVTVHCDEGDDILKSSRGKQSRQHQNSGHYRTHQSQPGKAENTGIQG